MKSGELDAAVVAQPEAGGSVRLNWRPLLRSEMRLIVPPQATETSVPALFKQYEWIRYDRQTISGMLAARYVTRQVRAGRGALELDSVPAIVAMVSAGLGIALVHLVDAGFCQSYPVRFVRLGRGAPAVQMSLVTRKADADSRPLRAVADAMTAALAARCGPLRGAEPGLSGVWQEAAGQDAAFEEWGGSDALKPCAASQSPQGVPTLHARSLDHLVRLQEQPLWTAVGYRPTADTIKLGRPSR